MIDNQPKEESKQSSGNSSSKFDFDNKITKELNCDINGQLTDQEIDCPICMTRVEDIAYTDSCFHKFCRKCIEKWSHSHNKCPICRQTYSSIVHNIRSNTEYDRIQLSKPLNNSQSGMLLIDENMGLLFTPRDSGVYMINTRQTPHGIQQNILFLASNQNFILQNMGTNVTLVRPEELDNVLSDLDQIEAVRQVGHHNTQAIPVLSEPIEDSYQINRYNN